MDTPPGKNQDIDAAGTRACQHCAATFIAKRSDRRFCSDRCRLQRWRQLQSRANDIPGNGPSDQESLLRELERLQQELGELRQDVAALRQTLEHREC